MVGKYDRVRVNVNRTRFDELIISLTLRCMSIQTNVAFNTFTASIKIECTYAKCLIENDNRCKGCVSYVVEYN